MKMTPDLSGLEEKPGGIVAYENALKRIRDLEVGMVCVEVWKHR